MANQYDLKVGDRVAYARDNTRKHFEVAGMAPCGIVVRVDNPADWELREAQRAPEAWQPVTVYWVVNEWFYRREALEVIPDPTCTAIFYTREELRLLDRNARTVK